MMERLIAEKNVRIAEMDDAVTLWRDRFIAEEKVRIRAEFGDGSLMMKRLIAEKERLVVEKEREKETLVVE